MQSTKKLVLLFLIFSLSGLRYTLSQHSSQCVAVITEINGKALVKEAAMSQFEKAPWGTRLFNGDQIATGENSEVKLLFSDNSIVTLGQNSMITISGGATPLTEPMGDVKRVESSLGLIYPRYHSGRRKERMLVPLQVSVPSLRESPLNRNRLIIL